MDINNSRKSLLVILCICLFFSISNFTFSNNWDDNTMESMPSGSHLRIQSFPETVVDKVFNLTVVRPYVKFNNNIAFQKQFTYYITINVETPHTCTLNITLWDPERTEFQLSYEEGITQDDYRQIPYGVAIEGNYTIHFIAINLVENLNIRINIERGYLALYDKINTFEQRDIIHYNVSKFYDGSMTNFTVLLKSDWYYKCYFGRVSPISKFLDYNVTLVQYIIDTTQGIPFIMYINNSLASPKDLSKYGFSTAIGGKYMTFITIYCNVTAVNVAFAVVELQRSTDGIDPNEPELPPESPSDNSTMPMNTTTANVKMEVPIEWTIGLIIGTGILVGIPILVVLSRKKKNTARL